MEFINYILSDGPLWAFVGTVLYVFVKFEPLIKSNLRNSHEKSLFASAERAIPQMNKLVDASPTDRFNYGIQLIVEFANKHGIPVTAELAKTFLGKAMSDFKLKGGVMATPKETVHVTSNGMIKEDDNK